MWIWLIPAAVAILNLASCSIETMDNDFEDDPSTREATIYLIADGSKPNMGDIEEVYNPHRDVYDVEEDDYIHPIRTRKRSGFVRYGRNERKLHVRFGRDTKCNGNSTQCSTIVRPGRNDLRARGKRSTDEGTTEQHEHKTGTGHAGSYLRFGRNFYNDDESLDEIRLLPFMKHVVIRENNDYDNNGYNTDKRYSLHVRGGRSDTRNKRSVFEDFDEQNRNEKPNTDREARSSTYMRFGRNDAEDDEYKVNQPISSALLLYLKQMLTRMNHESGCERTKRQSLHVRQGRSELLKRKKRSAFEDLDAQQEKQDKLMMERVGRASSYRRFGRNFHKDEEGTYNVGHSIPPVLLPLLKQYVARLYSENQFSGYPSSA